jgi:glycosyltransferase involved in cell wall biosynthesis
MRVAHVLWDLSGGGAERLVLDLCRHAGPEVACEVFTLSPGGALAAAFSTEGIPVHCVERRRRGVSQRLVRRLRGFDVVHTHLWAGDVWGRTAGWFARVPVRLSTEHNLDIDEGTVRIMAKVATAPLVHEVVAVSEAVARWWRRQGVAQVSVIPNGVDLTRFSAPHRGGAGVVAIGRLVPQKGLDVLIEASESIPGPVGIAGTGPLGEQLARDAPPNVLMLGRVEDIPGLLREADLVVVPSRWEGFGLVAVEAMAAGVPVVASAVDGLAEVVGDAGVLVPPGCSASLADAVRRVLADSDMRDALVARGRTRATRFDLLRTVGAYEDLYRSLHARNR